MQEAEQRWPLLRLDVLHRVGPLEPGEPIVFVGAASAHRDAAFDAVPLRHGLPENPGAILEEGKHLGRPRWVEGRASDQLAAERWNEKAEPSRR